MTVYIQPGNIRTFLLLSWKMTYVVTRLAGHNVEIIPSRGHSYQQKSRSRCGGYYCVIVWESWIDQAETRIWTSFPALVGSLNLFYSKWDEKPFWVEEWYGHFILYQLLWLECGMCTEGNRVEAGGQVRKLLQPSRWERVVTWTKKVVVEVKTSSHVLDIFWRNSWWNKLVDWMLRRIKEKEESGIISIFLA